MDAVDDTPGTGVPRAQGDLVVVTSAGELDWDFAGDFAGDLRNAVAGGCRLLVVDMSQVTFADSTALNALLTAQRDLAGTGRHLVVAGPLTTPVRRLFEVSGTIGHLEFAADLDAALRSGSPEE